MPEFCAGQSCSFTPNLKKHVFIGLVDHARCTSKSLNGKWLHIFPIYFPFNNGNEQPWRVLAQIMGAMWGLALSVVTKTVK